MYTSYELTDSQEIKQDKYGVPLLNCNRDTNALEGQHSHINNTFGKSRVGWEFADAILAERRHRGNIDACKRRVLGYPRLRHYDTWKIDAYQNRMEMKWNILVFQSWINTSDISLKTEESFGFTPLATDDLQNEMNDVLQKPSKMTQEIEFLVRSWKCTIPAQPWKTVKENRLFPLMLLDAQQKCSRMSGESVEHQIAFSILPHVDGIDVFPKFPVYNRIYAKKFEFGQRAKASTKRGPTGSIDSLLCLTMTQVHLEKGQENQDGEDACGKNDQSDDNEIETDDRRILLQTGNDRLLRYINAQFPPMHSLQFVHPTMPLPMPMINPLNCCPELDTTVNANSFKFNYTIR